MELPNGENTLDAMPGYDSRVKNRARFSQGL